MIDVMDMLHLSQVCRKWRFALTPVACTYVRSGPWKPLVPSSRSLVLNDTLVGSAIQTLLIRRQWSLPGRQLAGLFSLLGDLKSLDIDSHTLRAVINHFETHEDSLRNILPRSLTSIVLRCSLVHLSRMTMSIISCLAPEVRTFLVLTSINMTLEVKDIEYEEFSDEIAALRDRLQDACEQENVSVVFDIYLEEASEIDQDIWYSQYYDLYDQLEG
ncbi:hypothetical protein BJY04DRAFT_222721 [Aspergillus karnatakaensis]|uniref:uncharacterized protein n=1 Tax=Aspergillus karnatakaensis TaxID=1810916 RepID=UPI003CCE0ABA